MRHRCLIILGCLLVTSLFSCNKNKDKKPIQETPMEVDVAEVLMDSVMIYKEYPGKLTSTSMVEIVGRVNGTLKSRNYKPGDIVSAGQVLFVIDDTQYRNSVQQAQGQLDNALSEKEYYTKQYEAMQKAIASDAVSQMEVLQSKSNLEESEASIKTARANLQTAQTNLGYCVIRAPFTGRISAENMSPGSYIAGAASPVVLATLYEDSKFYADFYIEDSTLLHIMSGNGSTVAKDYEMIPISFSEPLSNDYKGKLEYVAPDVDSSTGTVMIRAIINNKNGELRDGMFVNVSLPYQSDPKALLVEDAAIGTDQQGKYVYTVDKEDKVVYTPIKTGSLVNGSMRVVTSGLEAGQKYVTKALLKVREGMKVKPLEGK